jgi:4-phospho-D-threonate 3-dehydrogenase / 4-phospho-D-erythronate 3-dehydrogenase
VSGLRDFSGAEGQYRPRIAVCMGDPSGIGPEIVVKALLEPEVYERCVPVVIGDARALERAPGWREAPQIARVDQAGQADPRPGIMSVVDLANVPASLKMGEAGAEGGRASVEYFKRGVELALAGDVDSVVSAPFNKQAMKMAGFNYLDEYEYLADMCGATDWTVMLVGPHFTLASVTLHVPMSRVSSMLTVERLLSTIRAGDRTARLAGVRRPRIGVAALNPHAGEGGTLGTEERDAIRPAVEAARAEGIDAHGPFPADSFFMTVKDPIYDVYVGMYHDQGRIAMKLLDFGKAVTMAEGMSVLFSTVGHGTAYDIVGQGIARHENMKDCILLSARRVLAGRAK